ncbi:hypothetical protein [Dietzia cinnamea]|uniref:Secreted protein n=1 Tax=Dietzia cinnamea TaxID=321318 RepID=A0A4R3ZT83_9ACTN|nr:hypothetical protein [Dietzia cinnamea]TCW23521.1 hypothetical protein EDD19_11282 [Dietzia cinnamea]
MFTRNRFVAGASAVALAAGATLAGAGMAGAQGSSEIAADLELAATALNGPVTVTPNDEGGPTVTYTNEGDALQHCVGFTMPYSSVDEVGLDPSAGNPMDLLPKIIEIQAMGGVSMLGAAADGEPTTYDATADNGITQAALLLIATKAGVALDEGESVTWEATAPEEPAAAAVLCIPDAVAGNEARIAAIETNFGIDPEVVANQINDRLGPLGSITAGSVSGGSVEMGANLGLSRGP